MQLLSYSDFSENTSETFADSCQPDLSNETDNVQDPAHTSTVIVEQSASSATSTLSILSSANLSRRPIWKNVKPKCISTQIEVPTWKGALQQV